jgi:hypothetical protein
MLTLIVLAVAVILLLLILRGLTILFRGTASAVDAAAEGLKKVGDSEAVAAMGRSVDRLEAYNREQVPNPWVRTLHTILGLIVMAFIVVVLVVLARHLL